VTGGRSEGGERRRGKEHMIERPKELRRRRQRKQKARKAKKRAAIAAAVKGTRKA
jgi:hypothetical protein